MNSDEREIDLPRILTISCAIILTILQVFFIFLRATNVVDWHWLFVLLPLIIVAGIFALFMFFGMLAAVVISGRD